MSVSKWKWTPECDRGICVGDCDLCDRAEPAFGEWIATSERIPDVHRSVLLATAEYAAEGELMGSYWWQYRWNARLKCEEVIAWMPLPEPYKMQNGKE